MSKTMVPGNTGTREVVANILLALLEIDKEFKKSSSRFVKFGARERVVIKRELKEVEKLDLVELYRLFVSIMFMRVYPMIMGTERKGGSDEYRERLEKILQASLKSYISIASTNKEIFFELRDFALSQDEELLDEKKLLLHLGAMIAESIEKVRVKKK